MPRKTARPCLKPAPFPDHIRALVTTVDPATLRDDLERFDLVPLDEPGGRALSADGSPYVRVASLEPLDIMPDLCTIQRVGERYTLDDGRVIDVTRDVDEVLFQRLMLRVALRSADVRSKMEKKVGKELIALFLAYQNGVEKVVVV